MKKNKAILLIEVMLVVLVVSIASLFLFRGYGIFLKTGRKSLDYLKLALSSEKIMWDLQLKESNEEINEDMQKQGDLDSGFSWNIELEDTDYEILKKIVLQIVPENRKAFLDTTIYLTTKKEE